jgi:hypothetical protein
MKQWYLDSTVGSIWCLLCASFTILLVCLLWCLSIQNRKMQCLPFLIMLLLPSKVIWIGVSTEQWIHLKINVFRAASQTSPRYHHTQHQKYTSRNLPFIYISVHSRQKHISVHSRQKQLVNVNQINLFHTQIIRTGKITMNRSSTL